GLTVLSSAFQERSILGDRLVSKVGYFSLSSTARSSAPRRQPRESEPLLLRPALDRTEPHHSDEPAPWTDEEPVPGKPAPRRRVRGMHSFLRRNEPGAFAIRLHAEAHHHLCDAGSGEPLEL